MRWPAVLTALTAAAGCGGGGTGGPEAPRELLDGARTFQTFTEDIRIGAPGAIPHHKLATCEVVPHHGPIISAIDRTRHELVATPAAIDAPDPDSATTAAGEVRWVFR